MSRFVTCSSSERSEVRVSIVVPRYVSSRMRVKRLGLVSKKKFSKEKNGGTIFLS